MTGPVAESMAPTSLSRMMQEDTGAWLTDDRTHRLALWRWWARAKPAVLFIGLNPSRASETVDDPTLHRMIWFASALGYGGLYVGNLFTLVTPYPKELQRRWPEAAAIGADVWLQYMANRCQAVVACWGCSGRWSRPRIQCILALLKRPVLSLGVNADGTPRHPLYLPKTTGFTPYWSPADPAAVDMP